MKAAMKRDAEKLAEMPAVMLNAKGKRHLRNIREEQREYAVVIRAQAIQRRAAKITETEEDQCTSK